MTHQIVLTAPSYTLTLMYHSDVFMADSGGMTGLVTAIERAHTLAVCDRIHFWENSPGTWRFKVDFPDPERSMKTDHDLSEVDYTLIDGSVKMLHRSEVELYQAVRDLLISLRRSFEVSSLDVEFV